MTTFLLVLTSRTMPDQAIAQHAETLKKMCGVTDGVRDDENDKVETGEDHRDPYPHFKTPLDKTASRPPRGLSPTVRKPGHLHRSRSTASSKSRKSPSPGCHVTSRWSTPHPLNSDTALHHGQGHRPHVLQIRPGGRRSVKLVLVLPRPSKLPEINTQVDRTVADHWTYSQHLAS